MSAFTAMGAEALARLRQLPDITNVASDLQQQGLTVNLVIDRETAARFGITPATVDNALYDLFGQRIISTIYTQSNQYRVIMEASPSLQTSLDALTAIRLPSAASTTGQVPLTAIVRIEQKPGPLQISHLGQFPATTISFDTTQGSSLGAAVTEIRQAEQDINLPEGFVTAFRGTPPKRCRRRCRMSCCWCWPRSSPSTSCWACCTKASFTRSRSCPRCRPASGQALLVALLIAGGDIDADLHHQHHSADRHRREEERDRLMIDFALDAEREEGKPPREAIHQACLLRFRPILMTTMAALLGALPLMLGNGTGSELRRPLGVAIVGGLIVSQVLTLFTTPVIYLMFDRLAWRLSGRGVARRGAPRGNTPTGNAPT